jgi:hypothetical protein
MIRLISRRFSPEGGTIPSDFDASFISAAILSQSRSGNGIRICF